MISREQGPEVEVGLLCYAHQVMADVIPEFLLVIVHRELMNVCPLVLEVKESMHCSSGLGRASPSMTRTESRPVGPIVSDENELLESVEQALNGQST